MTDMSLREVFEALLQPLRQCLAIEILHDQEVSLTFLTYVVERARTPTCRSLDLRFPN